MKRVIIIVGLFFAFTFSIHAQKICDTLKLKTIKTGYGLLTEGVYTTMGYLDGSVINIDTLSVSAFYPEVTFVNISNDTYPPYEGFMISITYEACADTGILVWTAGTVSFHYEMAFFPNDTMKINLVTVVGAEIEFLEMINGLKEVKGVDFEEISYWRMLIGVAYTGKDGYYNDSVYYAGEDTSIFYIRRGDVGIQKMEKEVCVISVYPNPARSQFIVTNTENATLQLYNMAGQEVLQTNNKGENTVVNVDFLPQGVYVLKVLKGDVFSTHKIVIKDQKY
jgi:hypothetical protein